MTKTIKPSLVVTAIILVVLLPILFNTTYDNINSYETTTNTSTIDSKYILDITINILLFLLVLFIITIRLNIKINKDCIQYRMRPWHKKFRTINKNDIQYISIEGKYFHVGIGITGTIDYAIGNGNCIKIQTIYGRKYLLSTGLKKDELIQLLHQYGYPAVS